MSRKVKDGILKGCIYASSTVTVLVLCLIIGFIFVKGVPLVNLDFLTRNYDAKTTYVTAPTAAGAGEDLQKEAGYVKNLGIVVASHEEQKGLEITEIGRDSTVKSAMDLQQNPYSLKKSDLITKIGVTDVKKLYEAAGGDDQKLIQSAVEKLNTADASVRLKVVRPGGGIVPMLITTLYMILLALLVAAPIGILSAVYLNEYAKPGKIVTIIRFAVQNLAGIPSIIYGLFGALFFVQFCKMKYSLLAGALTVSIILLPVIISTTEETLKSIPGTYRESSRGLGATKLQTTLKVVLPNALPGILVAVILSIGRIVGESAALMLTAGTVAQIPTALTGDHASGATLTLKAYTILKEQGNMGEACAIGVVLILLILILNISSKIVTNRFLRKNNG